MTLISIVVLAQAIAIFGMVRILGIQNKTIETLTKQIFIMQDILLNINEYVTLPKNNT